MLGTSREGFTVQKDRRELPAPDLPEPPQMQSLRRAVWTLTDTLNMKPQEGCETILLVQKTDNSPSNGAGLHHL